MGILIRYTHKKCNFEFEHHKGVGVHLFGQQLKARENMRSGKWGPEWQDLMNQYPEATATIGKVLCYCRKCNDYFSAPQIKFYVPQDGYRYEFSTPFDAINPADIIAKHYRLHRK